MRRIGLWMACGALALAMGCDNGRTTGTDSGPLTLPDAGPDTGTTGPRDSGTRDSGPVTTNCRTQPGFQACAECFCDQNMTGCNAYLTALVSNLYCGSTCMTNCEAFCADPSSTPTEACSTCVNGIDSSNPDVTAFQNACTADSNCVNFAQSLQMCPE